MYKIAITGKKNTGKNTLSKMLVKTIRKQVDKYQSVGYLAFANPIKEMARVMYPEMSRKFFFGSSKFRDEIIPGSFKDGKPLTVREVLKDLGTKGREYRDTIWLDIFDTRLKAMQYKKIVVVTDVRFRNEFEHLKNKGFYHIRLHRDTGLPTDTHISEAGQDDILDDEFDYVIYNDKSLNDLKLEVSNRIVPYLRP